MMTATRPLLPVVTRRTAVTGAAAPTVVWARYDEPGRWPSWAPHLTGVTCSAPRIAPGVTGVVRAAGVVRASFVVTDVRPLVHDATGAIPGAWEWSVRCGPLRLDLHHDVAPTAGGTRAGLAVTGPVGVVDAYLPLARWALRRLVAP